MEIDIEKLEAAMTILFSDIKKRKGTIINIEPDYYWDIPMDLIYNPYVEPKTEELTLGQLSYDWDPLCEIIEGEEILLWHFKLASNFIKVLCVADEED
jgi:hypothetical protein